ncbi:MAG TPA: ABC transporter ATP-binding protein [Candidatus Avidesulfovibrio excrementigallinarum]|nr:ABC transporter ATP-binding protein [Candidatus Avidesulfovibrio excrementigallinarum]
MPAGDVAPLLEVDELTVRLAPRHGVAFDAVHRVSFALAPGQTFCLVGESGCGKSLTALAILGLIPDIGRIVSGRILFAGQDLAGASEAALRTVRGRRIGMVFQEPMTSLNPVLRVGDQVAEVMEYHWRMGHREALQRTIELFRQVGIPSPDIRLRDYPHQLSGGLRQRVMIAMALACDPVLLLADEPTTALDVTIQGQILTLLREQAQQRGMGLLLITHDLGVVASMADAVGVMYAGRMVERASAADLFACPLHPYTRGLMQSAPTLDRLDQARLPAIAGSVPTPGELPEGCLFRPRCAEADERCLRRPPRVRLGCREVCCWLHAQAPSAQIVAGD